ncbi:hypothetical protein Cgig2_001606 [Carnegiea gigantea]|uniref:NB-ARC domain-containing protein n=1 Tax=Carnegiea gigantea TaxID=171969 RepID=A0A9Q1KCB7_9CARY|nr:hypothetical protein Cgig2_001606 [Carnegiea gigantea]
MADRTVSEVQNLLAPHIGEEGISTCTNLGTRYKLGKRAANPLKEVNELKGQVGHISISRPALPPSIELMPTSDFEAFESTKAARAKIIDALKHDDNEVVGVYGMGGVGKTSLIIEVAKYTKTKNMFDEVVIATVSQNPNLVKIQTEIAEGLGLQLIEKTSNQDSWSLFKKTANIVEPSDLKKVAKAITKECGGLPLALVTLGKFLRDEEPRVWENAACELRKSRPLYIKGMHEKVFSCLKLSFDHTHNEDSKLCYLYCSLFPEDYDVQIEALLRYGFGEGLFSDAETIDEARNRVHSIISDLEASCLLQRSDKEEYVKMHDVFRDLAISIASSNDYCFVVKASSGLNEWPAKSRLENVMRMSVVNNEFSKLPGRKEYPELLLLLLQNNMSVRAIPDDFLAGMGELRVLDLSNIPCLANLTPSFSSLTNLRTPCFENNILQDGKPLRKLKLLKILSLRKSSFVSFPEEIKALTNLRSLDLTDAKVGTIPANVISSLWGLEELYLGGSYSKWEVKESETQGTATLGEVLSLEYLTTLIIDIAKYSCLTEEISGPCSRLKKFNVLIGEGVRRQTAHGSRICFNISDKLGVPKPFKNWIKSFLRSTSELSIIKWKDLSSLEQLRLCDFRSVKHLHIQQCGLQAGLSASLFEKFAGLRDLEIFSCPKMETVFLFDDDDSQNNVLPELTTMHIQEAPRLSNIWRGATLSGCFQSLRDVKLESFGQIKYVFPLAVANGLNQLRLPEISNCETLEVVIYGGENDIKYQEPVFPQLQTLKLRHLQSLRSFSLPQQHLDFPSLEFLTLLSCPCLKKLPFGPKSSKRLVMIETEKEWLEELEFENHAS